MSTKITCPQCSSSLSSDSIVMQNVSCPTCGANLSLSLREDTSTFLSFEWNVVIGLIVLILVIFLADVVAVSILNQLSLTPDSYMSVYSHIGILIAVFMFLCLIGILLKYTPQSGYSDERYTVISADTKLEKNVPKPDKRSTFFYLLKRSLSIIMSIGVFILTMHTIGPFIKGVHESIPWNVHCEDSSKSEVENHTNHIVECIETLTRPH